MLTQNLMTLVVVAVTVMVLLVGCTQGVEGGGAGPMAEFVGDKAARKAAVSAWVAKGDAAIPELKAGLKDDRTSVRAGCREALAKITGQWGWDDGLRWRPDFETALKESKASGKPIMLLQLFGKFNEEFC